MDDSFGSTARVSPARRKGSFSQHVDPSDEAGRDGSYNVIKKERRSKSASATDEESIMPLRNDAAVAGKSGWERLVCLLEGERDENARLRERISQLEAENAELKQARPQLHAATSPLSPTLAPPRSSTADSYHTAARRSPSPLPQPRTRSPPQPTPDDSLAEDSFLARAEDTPVGWPLESVQSARSVLSEERIVSHAEMLTCTTSRERRTRGVSGSGDVSVLSDTSRVRATSCGTRVEHNGEASIIVDNVSGAVVGGGRRRPRDAPATTDAVERLRAALSPQTPQVVVDKLVDAMAAELLRQMPDLPIRKMGPSLYTLDTPMKRYKLAVHSGVLVVRLGGGYESVLTFLEKRAAVMNKRILRGAYRT